MRNDKGKENNNRKEWDWIEYIFSCKGKIID